ncbi:DUF3048 domain-containing protein [Clostridium paridis]|uniref:DUF3048 domain-containing protein n=1 Tax=Clostridium paridis TaxID=2803863 RepID=A0A937K4I1_9CLOT|nr:DUF3048 domain-containing protein [Clostridium paridis]MBL4931904.1 DUF3048 domain-containing protein [Clostridium paridis]
MKKKIIILIALSTMMLLTGCHKKAADTSKSASSDKTVSKYYAPYTGEEVTKDIAEKPAYMVSIENASPARPQAGFTSADIVYELMAEGGITRCLALYQKDEAAKIGPIRSMRTYFIDLAYEYNVPFAHCGGSHDALDRIKEENSMALDEMTNGAYYYRDKTIKVQEHSLFSSSENLLKLLKEKNYIKPSNVKLKFDKTFWDNSALNKANAVSIKFNPSYTTSYQFKDGLYYKSMNNEPTLNRDDNVPVAVKNIVIQNVKYRTRVGEPYLDADLVGNGDGVILSNGKQIKVTWSKADLNSQTIFKDEKGNIVPLNVGKTWWHILDQNAQLTIN